MSLKEFEIDGRKLSQNDPCYIIAEAGSNHNGALDQAKKLVDVAKEAQCDAVKFQMFKAEVLCPDETSDTYSILKKFEFKREWLEELKSYCGSQHISLLMTPFDTDAIDLMTQHQIPAIKWGSSEITKFNQLIYAAKTGLPMLVSTGMADLADIYEAVEVLNQIPSSTYSLFHCVSVYPTPAEEMNLAFMDTLERNFGCLVGLSDHSLGIHLPVAAVARGAKLIEKHFTLSRDLEGPDHSYALEPKELIEMVHSIRETEKAIGTSKKIIQPLEAKHGRRNGIYLKKDLPKGEEITEDKIELKPPATGVRARFKDAVLGLKTNKKISAKTALQWENLV